MEVGRKGVRGNGKEGRGGMEGGREEGRNEGRRGGMEGGREEGRNEGRRGGMEGGREKGREKRGKPSLTTHPAAQASLVLQVLLQLLYPCLQLSDLSLQTCYLTSILLHLLLEVDNLMILTVLGKGRKVGR